MAGRERSVAMRVGSIPETIVDGETGFLADAGDAQGLCERVERLLDNRELAGQTGRLARERVVLHYSIDQMICGYQDLISRLYASKQVR